MNKSKILITIDTEVGEKAKSVKDGFDRFILGKKGNEYYGIKKIVEILDDYNFKGEFFVDVYESKCFGEEGFEKLCKYLHEKGHGVQLHTHPSFAYDKKRINMHEYSLDEQITIISHGKELIKKWIGEYPIAHRAGNYGADNNTLKALNKNDLKIDSSFYHMLPNCKIKTSTINEPVWSNGVLEVPVTVFKKYAKIFNIPVIIKSDWVKLDINWLDYRDFTKSIIKLSKECKYIMLFLHSFSFVLDDYPHSVVVDKNLIMKFKSILGYIKEQDLEVIKFETGALYDI
jgi:hypothetical protein